MGRRRQTSIQIHPDDDFAKQYNGGRGKPEAWVILDTPEDGKIEFGHHAKNREEFVEWTENREWDKLLRYLKAEKDGFIDIPAGTLHAIGKGVLTYNISRNADLTLRLYDYDRVDPSTGKTRDIQPEEVYDNVNLPDKLIEFQQFPAANEFGTYWKRENIIILCHVILEGKAEYTGGDIVISLF